MLALVHPLSLGIQYVDAWLDSGLYQVTIAPLLHAANHIAVAIDELGCQYQIVATCFRFQIQSDDNIGVGWNLDLKETRVTTTALNVLDPGLAHVLCTVQHSKLVCNTKHIVCTHQCRVA